MSIWSAIGNIGKGINKFISSPLGGVVSGVGTSALSGMQQYQQQKKLMALQNQYEREAYNRQRADNLKDYATQRQDYISDITNQYGRQVESLQNAGLNPALAYGNLNGAQPLGATINQAQGGIMPSTSGAATYNFAENIKAMSLLKAQKENIEADTNEKNVNAGVVKSRYELDKEKWEKERDEVIPKQLQQADAEIQFKLSQKILNEKEADKVQKEIDILGKKFEMVTIDANMYQNFKDKEYEQLCSNVKKLDSETTLNGKLSALRDIEAQWKRIGIGVGSNIFESFYAMMSRNKGANVVETITNFFTSAITSIVDKLGMLFDNGVGDSSTAGSGVSIGKLDYRGVDAITGASVPARAKAKRERDNPKETPDYNYMRAVKEFIGSHFNPFDLNVSGMPAGEAMSAFIMSAYFHKYIQDWLTEKLKVPKQNNEK